MAVTKAEFSDWRDHPISKELLESINEQCNKIVEEILNRQDPNVNRDQYLKGMLSGFSQVVGFTPDWVEDKVAEAIEGEYIGADQ
jgi:hypothetical protein